MMMTFAALTAARAPATDATLKVIGAGMGRTGTNSLRTALNELGVGPTYHMDELLGISDVQARPVSPLEMMGLMGGHVGKWTEVGHNASVGALNDFSFLVEHYKSAVDFPSAVFWPELLKAYPDAKVVLTVRDAKSLHRSINGAWCRLIGGGSLLDRLVARVNSVRPYSVRYNRMHAWFSEATGRLVGIRDFSWLRACNDEAYALQAFKAWDAKVRASVPARQLLVFETGKHGYKELAQFLGVPVPDAPYPRSNSTSEFQFVIGIHRVLALLTLVVPGALVWCALRRSRAGVKSKGA